ncbi:MAG TPA: AmmeMemoRadiSam system protein A [Kofleriaceae bacterium]|nr:AmmeMemoRadiSam system protein A [Kofleriaceae bacterium]
MKTRGPVLAAWARAHLREALGGPTARRPAEPWCGERAATFVTLRWQSDGALQGCIGTLTAVRPIADDVAHHVIAAGLHDPRGEKLALCDVAVLDLEISLLSHLEPVAVADIRPGVDGLVLEHCGARATLLPVMWEQLPELAVFLAALKRKAGLPRGFDSPDVRYSRYTAERYVDPAPGAA